ncbi:MAG TPA: fluoride efflux transporter CrcB [Acidimicrobiales bacterium]|nr:fluoride efflux transporter CrcB [Acidimicrobiales bacterium]
MTPAAWAAMLGAGAVGAPARFLVDGWVADRVGGAFPWGTLVVNVAGSLVLGVVTGLVLYHGFPATTRVVAGTGFCGAFTTFSTFAYETVRLAEEGETRPAAVNVAVTLCSGLAAAAAGLALASAL